MQNRSCDPDQSSRHTLTDTTEPDAAEQRISDLVLRLSLPTTSPHWMCDVHFTFYWEVKPSYSSLRLHPITAPVPAGRNNSDLCGIWLHCSMDICGRFQTLTIGLKLNSTVCWLRAICRRLLTEESGEDLVFTWNRSDLYRLVKPPVSSYSFLTWRWREDKLSAKLQGSHSCRWWRHFCLPTST